MSPARQWGRTTWGLALLTLLLLAIVATGTVRLAFYGDNQKEQKETAQAGQAAEQADKKELAVQVKEACDKGGPEAKKLGALCNKAKQIIQEPTKPVEPTLSEKQVRNIVQEEVAKRNLVLTPSQVSTIATAAAKLVPKPKDGKTPTRAELQPLASAALATFCANGRCLGKDGKDAPPVTSDQLTATLAAWCAERNGCVGADGKNGENGEKGASGRGVSVSIEPIAGGNKVTFSYTDDTPSVSFVVMDGAPGEPGKAGAPGPACPTGYHLELRHIVSTEAPTGEESQVCMKDVEQP